ncbi:MAG TPA: metallopeptidase TldD-related protein [Thermoanaerobaculia bacterium]|nr:metallopeptidase TldD-related protein [Thermoanaerobaculia bacterium]
MPDLTLLPMDEMLARLDRVLTASPADATEIAWLEVRRGREETGRQQRPADGDTPSGYRERTLLVRVREAGRVGFHRTGFATVSELENAVRMALAQARLAPPTRAMPPGTAAGTSRPTDRGPELWDRELAGLDEGRARELVESWAGRSGAARLDWTVARVVVTGSGGRRRSAEVTTAALAVRQGRGPTAGRAVVASRSLAGLVPEAVAEEARRRAAPEGLADLPAAPPPLLLAPQAAAALVDLLNRLSLSSAAFHTGDSFLCERLGEPVFHPLVSLRDDATDPRGLPFPFDLAGEAKRPVNLIEQGVVRTPAVDPPLALRLGCAATPHAVALDESLATNLFLRPGAADEGELLGQAGAEGLWVGSLQPLQGFDPRRLAFRAVARGVRRIDNGALGRALPDLLWEASLAEVFARVLAVGRETVVVAGDEPLLGGISAPALVIGPTGRLAVAP